MKEAGFEYIAAETNTKGEAILRNNPYIDKLVLFEASRGLIAQQPLSFIEKRANYEAQAHNTTLINMQFSLENGYIAMEDMSEYYLSSEERRNLYGGRSFYEQTNFWLKKQLAVNGISSELNFVNKAQIYFTKSEEEAVKKIYEDKYKGKYVVVCNLSGSSRQKYFLNVEKIMKEFLNRHSDAVCITVGDEDTRKVLDFAGERVVNRAGKFDGENQYPFRQSMLMTKYADLAVGYESGLMIASTALGTPTVQLMTTSSIKNHGGGMESDYSLQSPASCSPCHKGPYEFIGCPKISVGSEKYPACIKFDVETVLDQMDKAYYQGKVCK